MTSCSALALIALFDPGQDPVVYFAFDPADATVTQRDGLREGALGDVLVDGRTGQTSSVDDVFQANDFHGAAPLSNGSEDSPSL